MLAAVVTALAVYSYLSYLRAQIPLSGRMVPMLVAASDIDSGVVVTAAMLEIESFPERYLPEQALSSSEAAVGRVAAVPILEGEPVTSRRLGMDGGSSSVVPDGMRAYSLSPDTLDGLALAPKAGDRVDVLATFAREGGNAETVTVIKAAKVASVGGSKGPSGVASQLGVGGGKGGITLPWCWRRTPVKRWGPGRTRRDPAGSARPPGRWCCSAPGSVTAVLSAP
jgi:Flp pilus assembly protein CpaB